MRHRTIYAALGLALGLGVLPVLAGPAAAQSAHQCDWTHENDGDDLVTTVTCGPLPAGTVEVRIQVSYEAAWGGSQGDINMWVPGETLGPYGFDDMHSCAEDNECTYSGNRAAGFTATVRQPGGAIPNVTAYRSGTVSYALGPPPCGDYVECDPVYVGSGTATMTTSYPLDSGLELGQWLPTLADGVGIAVDVGGLAADLVSWTTDYAVPALVTVVVLGVAIALLVRYARRFTRVA